MANMTQQMAVDELYNRWFQIADHDRDGRVMGQEAVAFLTRSGLPPATLGKIWEVAAQGAPWLDQASFRRVCQLMWYAQQNGNDLPADSRGVVMKIISGMATLPPPKLAGEEPPFALRDMRPIGIEMPQPAQQFSQSAGYMSQPTGASSVAAPVQSQSMHSQSLPTAAPSAHFQSGSTGQSFTSAQTGGAPGQVPGSMGAGPTGQPQYPDITTFLATKYGDTFKAAAKDQAGGIPGGEVLRLLGAVPVDIAVKKEAWDLVAGDKGALNPQEFFTLLYLLDLHTVNHSLPDSIPMGIFPPGVHQCFSAAGLPVPIALQPPTVAHVPLAQQNPVENLALAAEMFKDEKWSMEKHQEEEHDPLAALPSVPPKTTFEAPDEQPYNTDSRLPSVDSKKVSALSNASERERLQTSMKAATKLDKELYEAEVKFANSQQENDFYVASLQQLTIFKSRSERALLDTQSRADSAHREAQETRQRYEQMYANARAQASTAQDLQRHITEAMASKAEWESKVAVLQQELQALANATPELLEQLQYEVEELKGAVGASEAEKRAFEDQTAGLRASKAQLEDRVKTVKDELKTAQELMEEALISLNNAKQELDFTKTGEDAESLQAALEEAAAAYKALHIKACSAGVPVPKEAMIQSNEQTVWSKEDLIGARDWMKFANAGWTVMEDLPELPEIFDTTFYIAHNQSEPPDVIVPIIMSDDPFVEAEDIEDAPPRAPADAAAVAAADGTQPAAAGKAGAAAVPGDAPPAAATADAVSAAAVDPATPAAIAGGVEASKSRAAAHPAVPSAETAAAPGDVSTAAEPSAGPVDTAAAPAQAADPKGPAALPMDLFSAPPPDPSAAVPLPDSAERSFQTYIPQDASADASTVPSNTTALLPEIPSEALGVKQPGEAPKDTRGDTADMMKYAPTPAPTAELSAALGLSSAIGGPCSPPDTSDTADIQKFAPTPAPTAELSNSNLLPAPREATKSTGIPSLAAAAEAAASGTSAGDTTDITTAAPTPAPTAELSDSHLLPTAGRTVDSLGVPSLAAAAAAAASSGAAAASGPLIGGKSNPLTSLSIPEQGDSVPVLAQGIPVTPGSTSGITPGGSRSMKSSLSGIGKHASVTSELSGPLPGLSGRLMAPTPANSAALSMAGNSGVIDPSGQNYPGVRSLPQRATPLSLSQVAAKLEKHDAGSSTNLATPTFDPSEMAASPPDMGAPMPPGAPGTLPEESMEILEISASLPLAQQTQPAAPRGAPVQGGAPPPVFATSNPFAGGQQAAQDPSNPQPLSGPVAESTAQDSGLIGNSSMLEGTDSVFGWPDAGAARQGKSR